VWKTVQEGFTLRIRPSIARNDDTITLDIRPTVTQRSGPPVTEDIKYQPSVGSDSETLTVSRPSFITRSLGTTMHVKNGQTVVLGGLTTDVSDNTDSGVPGLRTVPGLGRLFSSSGKSVDRRNLMIFVTAHIIDPSGAKIGEDIRRLRDTASVVMPEEVRLAEAEMRVVEAQRAADAEAAAKEATERKPTPAPAGRTGTRR
jgi:general secretion pathway protein D